MLEIKSSDIKSNIDRGFGHLNACHGNIENGNKFTALAYLRIVQTILNEYPAQTEGLRLKYDKVKTLYEAQFGKLEKELV